MKPPARFTTCPLEALRTLRPQKLITDLDTAARILGTPRALLEAQLGCTPREALDALEAELVCSPELDAVHELDAEADAEGDFLRDLRLDEAYPLGAVPTCRDTRRGRTA